MSSDDLHRVILEIDSLVKSGLLFVLGLLFFVAFYLFVPFLVSILWLLYLFYNLLKIFLKWKKIFRLFQINA